MKLLLIEDDPEDVLLIEKALAPAPEGGLRR